MHTTHPRSKHTLASEGQEQGGRGKVGRQGESLGLWGCRGTPFPGLGPPSLTSCREESGNKALYIPDSQESYKGRTHLRGLSILYTDNDISTLAHMQYQHTAGAQMCPQDRTAVAQPRTYRIGHPARGDRATPHMGLSAVYGDQSRGMTTWGECCSLPS